LISYIEPKPFGDKLKGINFSKMQKRDFNFDVNNFPSVGYYKPNIDIIKKKEIRTIKFTRDKNLNKKFLLQKLWRSYDVGTDYKLVEFNN
jgi:hypothetical protein